jgi:hypothetical protein
MLRSFHELKGCALRARDGEIGAVRDLYFDEIGWAVRYFVVETGAWLRSRKVLISPEAVRGEGRTGELIPVDLTTDQVKRSPDVDTEQPVSRQYEAQMREHYRWPPYTTGQAVFAGATRSMAGPVAVRVAVEDPAPAGDPHLFSMNASKGHHLVATDGEIGHVDEFLVDDQAWLIRYLVVDTRNFLPGRKVLVAPKWIEGIDWPRRQLRVDLSRDAIRQSPAYDPAHPPAEEYLARLHRHYGRPADDLR